MPEMPAPMINTSTCSMLVVFMAPTVRQVRGSSLDSRGQSFDSSGQPGAGAAGDLASSVNLATQHADAASPDSQSRMAGEPSALEQVGNGLQARVVEHAGQHAAVVFDCGAVDEVRVTARQENADATHFRGLARATQRDGGKV